MFQRYELTAEGLRCYCTLYHSVFQLEALTELVSSMGFDLKKLVEAILAKDTEALRASDPSRQGTTAAPGTPEDDARQQRREGKPLLYVSRSDYICSCPRSVVSIPYVLVERMVQYIQNDRQQQSVQTLDAVDQSPFRQVCWC